MRKHSQQAGFAAISRGGGDSCMRDEPVKISIVVPIYNVEEYVRPCIESVIGQTYRNLEIILVDDGSTDRCPEICDDYAKKDKRIHVIHKHNGGLVSARKAGAAAAAGDYVLSVDGDDWIEKDRVEALVREGILPTHADMIYLAGYTVDFKEKSIRKSFDVPNKLFENDEIEDIIFPLLAGKDKVYHTSINWSLCMWCIRRELLLKNQMLVDDRVTFGEDFLGVCFCLMEAKSVMTLQQGGYHYIQRTSSIMDQIFNAPTKDRDPSRIKIWYQVLKNRLEQKHVSEKICKICHHLAIYHIFFYYDHDYDLLLHNFPNRLVPFPNVRSGARIVVYGAGKFGSGLIQSLDKTEKYSVVLWVDQNQNRPTVPGYSISSRDAIFSADYDFIVVAIMNEDTAQEVKRSLILEGIPEEKIATMDADAIL